MQTALFQGPIVEVRPVTSYIERKVHLFSSCTAVGLDLEWEPDRRRGSDHRPCLLQLFAKGVCYIFDLREYKFFPPSLKRFLESDRVVKAVAGCRTDKRKLLHHFGVHLRGEVDVLEKAVTLNLFQRKPSLARLTQELLGLEIDKSLQMSFRRNEPLTDEQLRYAATDAWIVHKVFFAL